MERLEAAMSDKQEITPEMRLRAISDLKHSMVKRHFSTSISRADFALSLDKENDELARLYLLIKELDRQIKESAAYKKIMLQCHHALENGN